MPKRWPKPPIPTLLTDSPRAEHCILPWFVALPHQTACKHGEGACEDCGTTDTRDALHTTRGGVGAVGRLFKKR